MVCCYKARGSNELWEIFAESSGCVTLDGNPIHAYLSVSPIASKSIVQKETKSWRSEKLVHPKIDFSVSVLCI